MPLPDKSILENTNSLANQNGNKPFVLPPSNMPSFTADVSPLETGGGTELSAEARESMSLAYSQRKA